MNMPSPFRTTLALLALVSAVTLLSAQEIAFGGIELASTSIKGLTFVFQPGTEVAAAGQPRSDRTKRLQYAERNTNFISMRDGCKLTPKGLALLLKDTQEVVAELREGAKAKNLGTLQLYAVGSSGLAAVCNRDEIVAAIQAATGLCMEFISAADEARYSLGFVLPRDRYRSLILDIGGGNTKAGYYVVTRGAAWPPREWHGLEIPYGARTLRDEALALMKTPAGADPQSEKAQPLTFYQAVDAVLRAKVQPQLQDLIAENSALPNFTQVYMVGGTVWATSTRMKPVQQQEWAISSLSTADFAKVQSDLKDDTFNEYDDEDFPIHVKPATKEAAENELKDVLQRFDAQSLYAGVSLARFIVEHTTPMARLYFPTTAAWISGYAREKFKETGRTVPACTALPATEKAATSAPVVRVP